MGAARGAKASGFPSALSRAWPICANLASVLRSAFLLSAIVVVLAATCSSASAHLIVVGSPLKGEFKGQDCTGPNGTWANDTLGEAGANASSPVDGVVVSWRMFGNFSSGKPFELRILHPAGGGAYTGAGTSAQEIAYSSLFSFPIWRTDLPIKAGDLVGINVNEDCVGVDGVTGSHYLNWFPALGDGSTLVAPYPGKDVEIGVQALVQPDPTATSISPATSALAGGGVVTIRGTDFEEASAVSFGGVPATDFSVEGAAQITAVVPPATKPGPVPVSVTTIAGTATASQMLDYQACVVPSLKGRTLGAAKKAVAAAGCALGKVAHRPVAKAKHGTKKPEVVTQRPPAGKTLPFGTKIGLTVSG
jgi:hypothetical protein